jgi:hypothetical protein
MRNYDEGSMAFFCGLISLHDPMFEEARILTKSSPVLAKSCSHHNELFKGSSLATSLMLCVKKSLKLIASLSFPDEFKFGSRQEHDPLFKARAKALFP